MTMLSGALAASPNGKKIFLAETTVGNQYNCQLPWNPNNFPGCQIWLRPDELQQDYANGQSISTWRDASGNGNNFTQSNNTIQPTFSANQINGLGCALFNGTTQYLLLNMNPLNKYFQGNQVTVFALINNLNINLNSGLAGARFTGDSNRIDIGPPDNAGTWNFDYGNAGGGNRLSIPTPAGYGNAFQLLTYTLAPNGTAAIQMNGVQEGSTTFSGQLDNTQSGNFILGAFGPDNGHYWDGYIVEFIVFNRYLSPTEQQGIWYYMATKYNLFSSFTLTDGVFYTPDTNTLIGLDYNGKALTGVGGLGPVVSGAGTYFADGTNVWYNPSGVFAPSGSTVQAFYEFYYSTEPKIFNGNYYQPRIEENGLPQLQMRVEKKFGTVGQIGGGNLTLANNDGYFDQFKDYQWDAGTTTIKMGYDYHDFVMPYSGYQPIATLLNYGIDYNQDQDFVINLYELKTRIKKRLTYNNYLTEYPHLSEGNYGSVKQLAYGKIYGAAPVIIDNTVATAASPTGTTATRAACKVSNHPITSFDDVRIQTNNTWKESAFAFADLTKGEFTPANWNGTDAVSVDFTGKPISSGLFVSSGLAVPSFVMDNAADIVLDILTNVLNESGIDVGSFIESHKRLEAGSYYGTGQRSTQARWSEYLDDTKKDQDAFTIIADLNSLVYSTLYIDAAGNYHFKVFQPLQASGLPSFGDESIDNFTEVTGDSNYSIVSKTAVTYAERKSENWGEFIQLEQSQNQWSHGQPSPVLDTVTLSTSYFDDANYWQYKDLNLNGKQFRTYQVDIYNPSAFTLQVGDQIHVQHKFNTVTNTYFRDVVLNIISATLDISGPKITVVGTDLHGLRDTTGFWAGDNDLLPTSFANLAGYGSGNASPWNPNWHPAIKTYVRQNYGYWQNDLSMIDISGVPDPASYQAGRWF